MTIYISILFVAFGAALVFSALYATLYFAATQYLRLLKDRLRVLSLESSGSEEDCRSAIRSINEMLYILARPFGVRMYFDSGFHLSHPVRSGNDSTRQPVNPDVQWMEMKATMVFLAFLPFLSLRLAWRVFSAMRKEPIGYARHKEVLSRMLNARPAS